MKVYVLEGIMHLKVTCEVTVTRNTNWKAPLGWQKLKTRTNWFCELQSQNIALSDWTHFIPPMLCFNVPQKIFDSIWQISEYFIGVKSLLHVKHRRKVLPTELSAAASSSIAATATVLGFVDVTRTVGPGLGTVPGLRKFQVSWGEFLYLLIVDEVYSWKLPCKTYVSFSLYHVPVPKTTFSM